MHPNTSSFSCSSRGVRFGRSTLATGVLSFVAAPAHAASLGTCHPGDSDLVCHLRSVLSFLDAAAWVLALLFVAVLLAVIQIFRRKGRKLSREEITPDAH